MAEFTFLEVHLRDANLHAGRSDETADQPVGQSAEQLEPDSDGSRLGAVLAALIGVFFLAAVAYAVKKAVGGEGATDDDTAIADDL
ncbi:uncharacterized protein NP_4304A [Natronomonas pharaonis DSM 2160]|uniref:Uncharacterized protein n=1 Tax=Natronomonas pharaonis (strain ATCC 35678 / DSM 2160 / CIP 103997 / JCM 8858 / NBRC 14720 / NCIMB 2260 / Gabara) TaxID=348780 RepID=A0A1U7EYE1_NATPD|nr:hypothetical protein [Natronomonas pharaonis]CAI50243.1 uncharacterized protein NP_4304A [Natronomonas pharaonis DSM 2160]